VERRASSPVHPTADRTLARESLLAAGGMGAASDLNRLISTFYQLQRNVLRAAASEYAPHPRYRSAAARSPPETASEMRETPAPEGRTSLAQRVSAGKVAESRKA
jgi:hypothetical protein